MRTTKSLGARITRAREDAGLTREELARAFGVSVPSVRNWELDLATPRESMLERVERWLRSGALPEAA